MEFDQGRVCHDARPWFVSRVVLRSGQTGAAETTLTACCISRSDRCVHISPLPRPSNAAVAQLLDAELQELSDGMALSNLSQFNR